MSIWRHFGVLTMISIAMNTATAQPEQARSVDGDSKSNAKPKEIEVEIREILKSLGQDVTAAIWLGGVEGPTAIRANADEVMPSASSIKTFFLVEFFASRSDALDAPVPGADAILANDAHPAISHFSEDQKRDIRATLNGQSARKLGEIMMGKAPASNVAYNAAASLITAVMGGPEELTRRVQARDQAFSTVFVRRYMLRDRNERGDNEITAAALAELYRKLATRSLKGVDRGTFDAIRNATIRTGNATEGFVFSKSGALDSDPLTRVEAGWAEGPGGKEPIVFVVMLRQAKPGADQERQQAGRALAETCGSIRRMLLDSGRN